MGVDCDVTGDTTVGVGCDVIGGYVIGEQSSFFFFFLKSQLLYPTKECSATGQLCIRELLSYSDPFNSEYNKSHAAFHIERATYTLGRNQGVGVVTHDHNAYHCASRLPRRSLSFSSLTVIEWALDDSALRKVMTSNYNY